MKVSLKQGLNIIKNISKKMSSEIVPLEEAIERVCAKDYIAKFNLPRFNNSAMDGYCVKVDNKGKRVKIIDTILAGQDKDLKVESGCTIKIMTGARIPKGCEAVVPFEDTKIEDGFIILPDNIKSFANIRESGEDIKEKETIVKKGEILDAYKIGVLASQGYSYIEVFKRVKVAVFATGSELKMHYENILPHQIYNSNTPTFFARAKELGCEVAFLKSSSDSLDEIKKLIENSLDFDILITSGGVSVGEADFTKKAFLNLGAKIYFDKVEIKPGKPTTFGKIKDTYILNLPGNPLAASINFEIFGRFLINILSNRVDFYHNIIECKLKESIKNRPGRDVAIPGYYDGEYFIPSKKRGPGMVSVLSNANGFIILDKDVKFLEKEKIVKFIPIKFDFYSKKEIEILTK